VQDLFSFSFIFADFMDDLWKYIVIRRDVVK